MAEPRSTALVVASHHSNWERGYSNVTRTIRNILRWSWAFSGETKLAGLDRRAFLLSKLLFEGTCENCRTIVDATHYGFHFRGVSCSSPRTSIVPDQVVTPCSYRSSLASPSSPFSPLQWSNWSPRLTSPPSGYHCSTPCPCSDASNGPPPPSKHVERDVLHCSWLQCNCPWRNDVSVWIRLACA